MPTRAPKAPDRHATTRDRASTKPTRVERRALMALRVCAGPSHPAGLEGGLPSIALDRALRVGRDATISLADPRVSRVHCALAREGNRFTITDLESRNGTFVDGRRLDRGEAHPLELGDVVRVGDSLFVFAPHTDATSAALPPPLRGTSAALGAVGRTIARVAPSSLCVLLLGETGAGKEVVAEALHRKSGRTGAFVPVNVSALPEPLVESELFGHARGAFTGAVTASAGLIRAAAGGTLFLDEIGDLAPAAQAKLLRVLDAPRVRAVGASSEIAVDVRIIAATHADLAALVAEKRFRRDLYERLREEIIFIAPLRERVEDVPVLLMAFLAEAGVSAARFTADAMERLLLHRWPGNARELRALARRLATFARDGLGSAKAPFDVEHLGALGPTNDAPAVALDEEARRLRDLLIEHEGNVKRIAEALGKDRRQIYRWLRRARLDPDSFRGGP